MKTQRPADARGHVARFAAFALMTVGLVVPGAGRAAATGGFQGGDRQTGISNDCVDFKLEILGGFIDDVLELGVLDDFGLYDIDEETFQLDLPDEGWVWVDPSDHFRAVSGVVTGSHTATVDFPATHDSHDQNTIVKVDLGQEGLLSIVNGPNEEGETDLVPSTSIELEWEVGTFPDETGRNEPERFFPHWVWPSIGDRVWAEGHWVYDCGHATEIDGDDRFRTEIHPPRAFATMREAFHQLPGSGDTRVPVTRTDLYIHGRAGYVTNVLEFGQESIAATGVVGPPHDVNDHVQTPIDETYNFDVCLPERPAPGAVPAASFHDGPGNDIDIPPVLDFEPATGACADAAPLQLDVTVDLAGSGVAPDRTYARRIDAGWIAADQLRRFQVSLNRMNLHEDHEVEFSLGGDCECTFFFVDVDKAHNGQWERLARTWQETCNFSTPLGCVDHNTLNDYDSDEGFGNGYLNFDGPTFDVIVRDGHPFYIHATGYDQDCQDDLFDGLHIWDPYSYSVCYYLAAIPTFETGRNDGFSRPLACYVDSETSRCDEDSTEIVTGYGVGEHEIQGGDEYGLRFEVEEVPIAPDAADHAVSKTCTQDAEVPIVGEPFTCTIVVQNLGPGLPLGPIVVEDEISTDLPPGGYLLETPTFVVTFGDEAGDEVECSVSGGSFSCPVGWVPVGGAATITASITPLGPGMIGDTATVDSPAEDPDATNDSGSFDVQTYLGIDLDISPGKEVATVNVFKSGVIAIAVLRTPDLDPGTIDLSTLCFGDAEDPAQRDCTEAHDTAHLQDVDKDGDLDLLLHYEVSQTGIDLGDAEACLIGDLLTTGGVYGCGPIRTVG